MLKLFAFLLIAIPFLLAIHRMMRREPMIRPTLGGLSRRFLLLIVAAMAALWIFHQLHTLYIESLWWTEDLRQPEAFWTIIRTQWGWGAIFALAAMVFMGVNLWFARQRSTPHLVNGSARFLARLVGLFGMLIAFQHGLSFGSANWQRILLWKNGGPFGIQDPIFGRDAGFYVFRLPLMQGLAGWYLGLVVLTLVVVVVAFFLRAAGRLGFRPVGPQGTLTLYVRDEGSAPAWNQLLTHGSVLGILLLLGLMAQTRLAMWALMFSKRGVVYGPGYTDVHVMLPAYWAMLAALAVGAVLLLIAVRSRSLAATWKAVRAGVVLVVLVALFGLSLIPGIVQRYTVTPNETNLEIPYIRHNMKFTRLGFGLTDDRIELRDFPPLKTIEPASLSADSVTLANVRLWDWRALELTYNQNQSFRQYYDFGDVDIDRYVVNGHLRQVMLSLRELNATAFTENAATWLNLRLIYTHGYGLCMNPTNEFSTEGLPNYWIRDIPPVAVDPILKISRPEVYFGELGGPPVYAGSGQREFDYPRGDQNEYAAYSGLGGVRVGSGIRRLALALRFDGLRQLTSSDIKAGTKLLLRRNVMSRLRAAAPFLTFDHDPYAVVADGRLFLVVDAYTTSYHFPYSERIDGGVNYIRNAVKATVDCYDGTVRLYVFEPDDPVIKAWQRAFPHLLTDARQMPPALRAHVRYPEDMLSIQARAYATYHMTDPMVFYNKEDRWAIARQSSGGNDVHEMIPYYAVMKLPGEPRAEFVQMIPFTPFSAGQPKSNMVAWIAGRCDGDEYGRLLVYRFPKQSLIFGPMQIEARIDQDADISKDLSLWNQQGSSVIRGNLIVLPLQNALMYVQPIFLQATHSRMPELKRVVVATQDGLGYGSTFPAALSDMVQEALPGALSSAISTEQGAAERARSPEGAGLGSGDEMKAAREHYQRYLEMAGQGRLAEAGQELEKVGQALGVARPAGRGRQ